jgi:hypothetical protein
MLGGLLLVNFPGLLLVNVGKKYVLGFFPALGVYVVDYQILYTTLSFRQSPDAIHMFLVYITIIPYL